MWTGAVHGQCPGVCPDYRVVTEGVWVGGEGPPQTGRGGQPSSHHIYNTQSLLIVIDYLEKTQIFNQRLK